MSNKKIISLILRIGLAFAFLYPPVAAFFDPFSWIGYFPQFMREIVSNDTLLLHSFGALEIVIAFWFLWGKKLLIPGIAASAMLLAIILFNWSQMDILFRDFSILAMAIALVILHQKPK